MEQCLLCNYKSDSKGKLGKHISFTHKLKIGDYIIQTKYSGIHPICICGCNTKLTYRPTLGDFPKYIKKHLKTIQKGKSQTDIFGDMNNPKRVQKIIKTRKEKFKSGEYNHVINAIKENRKNPNLGKNISKGAKGIPKPKPKGFGIGRFHTQKTKDKMSNTAMKRIIKSNHKHTSKLEDYFCTLLESLSIKYTQFYYAKSIKGFYDIYLTNYNILIEVDGDFWHCNPKIYKNGIICKTQLINKKRDEEKNDWAKDNGFKLLRFWEKDIKDNPSQVLEILKKELNLESQ